MAVDLAMELDPDSPVPLYHQIADGLKAQIEGGSLTRGEYLPSELVLADAWRVSRPTARRALQELVASGMVVRRRGVGTQVVASRASSSKPTRVPTHSSSARTSSSSNSEPATQRVTRARQSYSGPK